jgi:hypothetical protein
MELFCCECLLDENFGGTGRRIALRQSGLTHPRCQSCDCLFLHMHQSPMFLTICRTLDVPPPGLFGRHKLAHPAGQANDLKSFRPFCSRRQDASSGLRKAIARTRGLAQSKTWRSRRRPRSNAKRLGPILPAIRKRINDERHASIASCPQWRASP